MELPKGRRRPRIGRIPYLITTPFTSDWPSATDDFEFITAPPRQLGHLARQDELDAACVPIADVRALGRRFEPLGHFGLSVANTVPVASFSARVEADLLGSAPLGVSMQGATTVNLLELVLVHRYGVQHPNIVSLEPDRRHLGGILVVGDQAAVAGSEHATAFMHHYDLIEEWHTWTALPFVLGRWMVRKTLRDEVKERLHTCIDQSVQLALRQPELVIAAHGMEQQIQWETERALSHLAACRFHLGDPEDKAVDLFHKLMRERSQKEASWRDLL